MFTAGLIGLCLQAIPPPTGKVELELWSHVVRPWCAGLATSNTAVPRPCNHPYTGYSYSALYGVGGSRYQQSLPFMYNYLYVLCRNIYFCRAQIINTRVRVSHCCCCVCVCWCVGVCVCVRTCMYVCVCVYV